VNGVIYDVFLVCDEKPGAAGYQYSAYLHGELLGRWRAPASNACRAMLDLGCDPRGEARFWRAGKPNWDFRYQSVAAGAKVQVEEGKNGLTLRRFRSFDWARSADKLTTEQGSSDEAA